MVKNRRKAAAAVTLASLALILIATGGTQSNATTVKLDTGMIQGAPTAGARAGRAPARS